MKALRKFYTFLLLLLVLFLLGCTNKKYVIQDIPIANFETIKSCQTLDTINFKEGDTEIDIANKLLDERKQHKDCFLLNESKKNWIKSLENSNKKT